MPEPQHGLFARPGRCNGREFAVFAIPGDVFGPMVLALMAQLESREPLPVVGRPCPGRPLSGLNTPLERT